MIITKTAQGSRNAVLAVVQRMLRHDSVPPIAANLMDDALAA